MPSALRRANLNIENSRIETQAITFNKNRFHMESAVATLPPGTRYVSFTTVFGTPPQVSIAFAGTTVRMQAGTTRLSADIIRVRPGSFRWVGSPNVRVRWTAWGAR